jgi:hypothetical protein
VIKKWKILKTFLGFSQYLNLKQGCSFKNNFMQWEGLKLRLKSKLSDAFSLFLFPKENHRVTGFH